MEIDIGNVPMCLSSLSLFSSSAVFLPAVMRHAITYRLTVGQERGWGMIKRARTARDFLDTSQSSTLERRSREEEKKGKMVAEKYPSTRLGFQ